MPYEQMILNTNTNDLHKEDEQYNQNQYTQCIAQSIIPQSFYDIQKK